MKRLLTFIYLLASYFNVGAFNVWNSYKAQQYYQKQDYVNAGKHSEKLLLVDPHDIVNIINMANILYQQGKYLEAAHYFEQALQHEAQLNQIAGSQKNEVLFNLGSAYAQQEKWQAALDAYTELIKFDPTNARALKNIEIIKKLLEKQREQEKSKDTKEQDKPKDQDDLQASQNNDQKNDQGNEQKNDEQAGKQPDKQPGSNQNPGNQPESAQNQAGQPEQLGPNNHHEARPESCKQEQSGEQPKKAGDSGQTSGPLQEKQQDQPAHQASLAKLNDQEKEYLEAIAQNDQRANNYLMKLQMQGVQGPKNEEGSYW